MTLEASIKFDEEYTNAKIKGLNMTTYFEDFKDNNIEICKKCEHGDGKGRCITREEALFHSFGCVKNNQFKEIKENDR